MGDCDIAGDCSPSRRPIHGPLHRLLDCAYGDRRQLRKERRENRREHVREAIDQLTGGDLAPLRKTVRQAFQALLKFVSNLAGQPHFEREDGGILKGGKLACKFDLREPTTIDLPGVEQNGFTPKTLKLGKHVELKIGKDGLELSGVTVNGKYKVPVLGEREISAEIKTATVQMKGNKPYLKIEIADPSDPKKKIAIPLIPLFHDT